MRVITAFVFTLLFATIALCQSGSSENSFAAATIILKPAGGQLTYELEGNPVPARELLNRLGDRFAKGDSNQRRLNILAHQDVKLTDIFGVLALAGKVGFTDTKIYCYDKQKRGMSELTIGAERPYTVVP